MSVWNPQLYLKFGAERTRPAVDLAARVDVPEPRRIIDLGCGPGNSTAVLRARWPGADVTGLDSDSAMLAEAARSDPEVHWVQADAATWEPAEPYDVVFSNALLQWLPDHANAVPRLFHAVAPGGVLAVQMPSHTRSRLHHHIREVANLPEWRAATARARHGIIPHDAGFYYDLLGGLADRIDLWETDYFHVMDSPEAILMWIRATGLRPFLDALDTDEERSRFEAAVLDRSAESFPRRRNGRILFPFPRLFFVCRRGASG